MAWPTPEKKPGDQGPEDSRCWKKSTCACLRVISFFSGSSGGIPRTKSFHGMECQNLLPYTCDVKGAQNDITMNWDGKQFVIDEMETSTAGKSPYGTRSGQTSRPHHLFRLENTETPAGPGSDCSRFMPRELQRRALRTTFMRPTRGTIERRAQQIQRRNWRDLEKALAGNWTTTYDFAPGGMSPNGGTGTGEENWRTGPGGYVLMEEEHVRGPRGRCFLSHCTGGTTPPIVSAGCCATILVRQLAISTPTPIAL